MNNLDGAALRSILVMVTEEIERQKDHLCKLDSEVGDGDHGVSMTIGMRAGRLNLQELDAPDAEQCFRAVAEAFADEVGASVGPLYEELLGAIATVLGQAESSGELESSAVWAAAFEAAADAITSVGGAEPGDKTMLDAWHPAATALRAAAESRAALAPALAAAASAAARGVTETKELIPRLGRASRLGERARGFPDAGAASASIIINTLASGVRRALNEEPEITVNRDLREYLKTAIDAAHAAARLQIAGIGSDLGIATKSSAIDLVTQIDKACEEKIREIIATRYPEHTILGEEEGESAGEARYRWVVDPLDGTVNYAHGFPFWCVSIGLEIDGELAVGVVFDALRNELFTATAGGGAYLNGAPISVTGRSELTSCIISTGFAYTVTEMLENVEILRRVLPHVQGIRRPGAAALDLAYVACGRADGFWELTLSPWDVAAATLLIREAGGTVTNAAGGHYLLGDEVIVASNGRMHDQLLALVQEAEPIPAV